MLLGLHNRSGRAMLLKTDKAYEAHNVTENKTDFVTYIFFLEHCLDLGLLHLLSWFAFPISLEHKSKVSQKPCYNDLSKVALFKELVERTVESDYTKATNASVHKKVCESVFKYVLLNCTLNRGVCKRT